MPVTLELPRSGIEADDVRDRKGEGEIVRSTRFKDRDAKVIEDTAVSQGDRFPVPSTLVVEVKCLDQWGQKKRESSRSGNCFCDRCIRSACR